VTSRIIIEDHFRYPRDNRSDCVLFHLVILSPILPPVKPEKIIRAVGSTHRGNKPQHEGCQQILSPRPCHQERPNAILHKRRVCEEPVPDSLNSPPNPARKVF
jgi:hypothetical protein